MLYIIGLGLHIDGISKYGLEVVKRCKKVYLESYTVDFPYTISELGEVIGNKKIILADREKVENFEILDESEKMDIALLVYGSPLTATTHISIIEEAKKSRMRYKLIYSASIIDAVGETGLQLYKFGKIASIAKWDKEKNFTPESFIEIIKDNQKINAHTLILIDIGMSFPDALEQLTSVAKKHKVKLNKLIVCKQMGTPKSKVIYKTISEFEEYKNVSKPYCIIVPAKKLNFTEEEFLEGFSGK